MEHGRSVVEVADAMIQEGAEIIWVLEEDTNQLPGTAERCMEVMDLLGDPSVGWCVGDAETLPQAGAFDDSSFAIGRGFDIIVPRDTMLIEYATSHGTPGGNENLDGEDVLRELRRIVSDL